MRLTIRSNGSSSSSGASSGTHLLGGYRLLHLLALLPATMLREKVLCSPGRLRQTFPSIQVAEELLGPEQRAGTISSRDFEIAKRYIPRNNTYPFLYVSPSCRF